MQLLKGDLILLDDESRGENILNGSWCSGRNERTGERGDFPSEVVYIIPAMSKPPPDVLVSKHSKPYSFFFGVNNYTPPHTEKTHRKANYSCVKFVNHVS